MSQPTPPTPRFQTPPGAFKFRGAYNSVAQLPEAAAARGVATHRCASGRSKGRKGAAQNGASGASVCPRGRSLITAPHVCARSSGNHAAALALAAKLRGIPAQIVVRCRVLCNDLAAFARGDKSNLKSGLAVREELPVCQAARGRRARQTHCACARRRRALTRRSPATRRSARWTPFGSTEVGCGPAARGEACRARSFCRSPRALPRLAARPGLQALIAIQQNQLFMLCSTQSPYVPSIRARRQPRVL